jgi:hypothetical protein
MLKTLLIGFILGTTALVADTTISLGTKIGGDNKNHQVKKIQKFKKKTSKSKNSKRFKKDHHRYDKRYSNFDYDRNGYYNDDGFYFGFYDRDGYFFNNIYFEYNSRYTYRDRVYIRGEFRPDRHHYRRYRHHSYNDWNRVHCYREPDEIVYGHYYEERYYPRDRRTHHRDSYREYQRNSYRRDNYYRDYDYDYYDRDSYSRSYRRDDATIRRDRFSNESSSRHRSSSRRRDNASIRRDRFSDKKKSKSSGRLQITK